MHQQLLRHENELALEGTFISGRTVETVPDETGNTRPRKEEGSEYRTGEGVMDVRSVLLEEVKDFV